MRDSLLRCRPIHFFANSVDPDKRAHYEPSHQDLHCGTFCRFLTVDPIFNNGSDQIQRWKSVPQKLRDDMVKRGIVFSWIRHYAFHSPPILTNAT